MPTIRESQNVDRSRLHDDHRSMNQRPHAPMLEQTSMVSTFMHSSLPVIAAGTDLYVRQFYNNGRLPQRRFLPVGGQ